MKFCSSRVLLSLSLLAPLGLLSAAAAEAPVCPLTAAVQAPTQLDYLVLASFADSSHLLSMSAYGLRAGNKGRDVKSPESGVSNAAP